MRIGVFMGTVGAAATVEGQVQQAVDAESDGFDSYWTPQVSGADALTLLALIGQRTGRIELGTAVVPTFPRHPMMLAQQALTVQAATDGRLVLGIGLSHRPVVEDRWGLSFDTPALHMEQYLDVLRSLMETGKVAYSDTLFNVSGEIQRMSVAPLKICVAALGPRMLRLAGERADGTITWMVGRKTLDTHVVPRIVRAAERCGRQAPRVCVGLPICVTDDTSVALEAAGRLFSRYTDLPSYRRMLDLEGSKSPADVAIIGDEAEVEAQVRGLAAVGATDFLASMFPAGGNPEGSVARTRALLKGLVDGI